MLFLSHTVHNYINNFVLEDILEMVKENRRFIHYGEGNGTLLKNSFSVCVESLNFIFS